MKAMTVLALLAVASPAFAQGQKPFLYDRLITQRERAPVDHPVTVITSGETAITPLPAAPPHPSRHSPRTRS
jgi:hypothetical protein